MCLDFESICLLYYCRVLLQMTESYFKGKPVVDTALMMEVHLSKTVEDKSASCISIVQILLKIFPLNTNVNFNKITDLLVNLCLIRIFIVLKPN